MIYGKVLESMIEAEKSGRAYVCLNEDRKLFRKMLCEIRQSTGVDVRYLVEIDSFHIPGAGEVIARYITQFSSEGVKGYLITSLVADKVKDCDKLILQLYEGFRRSGEYISAPGAPAPAYIYVRYDNAFKRLRPKRLAKELTELAHDPRDAFYLPFTMRMLASWKLPEMESLLKGYLNSDALTADELGIYSDDICPKIDVIRRELKFTGIAGLKYYPSPETKALIEPFAGSENKDFRMAAERTLKAMP